MLSRIVDRRGAGHRIAQNILDELTEAAEQENEEAMKRGIVHFYASLIASKKYLAYVTPDEAKQAAELWGRYRPMLPDFSKEMEGVVKYASDEKKRPMVTLDAFEMFLESKGIRLRRNLITHKIEITGWNDGENPRFSKELEEDHFPVILADELKESFTGITTAGTADFISVVAGENEYNPVLEELGKETWDTKDRWPELFSIMGVIDEHEQTLIKKWFLQTVALQFNGKNGEVFGADGVLVLQGKQGGGKSEFARRISDITGDGSLFLPGAIIDPKDKDSVIQATGRYVTEWGELDSTFNKADQGRLKAFITLPYDTYRVPFGRNGVSVLRRTSFIATVNPEDFLLDSTGERRWWVIHTDKIDLDRLDKLDKLQLWRQAAAELIAGGFKSFRLTEAERDELNARNKLHEKPIPGEMELRDILLQYRGEIPTRIKFASNEVERSASQIADEYDLHFSSVQIGKALQKIGVPCRRVGSGRLYVFPMQQFPKASLTSSKSMQQD